MIPLLPPPNQETNDRDQSDYGPNGQGIGPSGVETWNFGNIVVRSDLLDILLSPEATANL